MAKAPAMDLVPAGQYRIATMDPEEIRELIDANLGGGGMSLWDLPRITVPTGKPPYFWTVGEEAVRTLTGVIVHQRQVRRFYRHGLDQGGEKGPPDCGSMDMVEGVGDPGGLCAPCPFSQWGSATQAGGPDRRGQACKVYRMLVMQLPDRITQSIVMVPPTSLGKMQKYFFDLTGEGKPYHRVVTELSFEVDTKSGNQTAIVVPRAVADIPREDHAAHYRPLVERFKELIEG